MVTMGMATRTADGGQGDDAGMNGGTQTASGPTTGPSHTKPTDSGGYLGAGSGLTFARLLLAAVKLKVRPVGASDSSTQKTLLPEPIGLPPKRVAEDYLRLYFSQANPQMPILHREDFVKRYFVPIYGKLTRGVSLANDYTVSGCDFASDKDEFRDSYYYRHYVKDRAAAGGSVGGGSVGSGSPTVSRSSVAAAGDDDDPVHHPTPRPELFFLNIVFAIATSVRMLENPQRLAEQYKAAAQLHFECVFASQDRLEALQGLLLLSLYSIMRPATPGVWYVLGTAMRLCVDLGLHNEEKKPWALEDAGGANGAAGIPAPTTSTTSLAPQTSASRLGRKLSGSVSVSPAKLAHEWSLDMRRRLFWCTYALDRQVCVYMGRPFGIAEESIKVKFPSELDDALVGTAVGASMTSSGAFGTRSLSYKSVSLSFFRIRQLQAEIQRVLYDCAPIPREFGSLEAWRESMAGRLHEWHNNCPKSHKKMNCAFNVGFFDLNYHQSRLLLYGISPATRYLTPASCQIIANAGANIIERYNELHGNSCINYTWVAVHNLFMAGTSYLYAMYHSPEVRQAATIEELEFECMACLRVLEALRGHCAAAESCRDTFELLASAIIRLCREEKESLATAQAQLVPQRAATTAGSSPSVLSHNGGGSGGGDFAATAAVGTSASAAGLLGPTLDALQEDLDAFFRKAADLDSASAKSPESLQGSTAPYYDWPGLPDQQQQPHTHGSPANGPGGFSNHTVDNQRIFDYINEVPNARIWDQFFANGLPHDTL